MVTPWTQLTIGVQKWFRSSHVASPPSDSGLGLILLYIMPSVAILLVPNTRPDKVHNRANGIFALRD